MQHSPADGDPIEGVPSARGGVKPEAGMRITPEVMLFVGGAILTVALFAVFIPFCVKVWREDSARRRAGGGGGGAA